MEGNKSLYDWKDYLVVIIIGVIFSFAFISYLEPKGKNIIIHHPEHKSPFDSYKQEWTKK